MAPFEAPTDNLDLEESAALPDDEAVLRLRELRGVGRWTAEYALLRGLGRTHVFPGDDVGARNNLQRWLRLTKPLDYEGVRRVQSRWDGYAGLVYFHLLLDRLAEAGHLSGTNSQDPGSRIAFWSNILGRHTTPQQGKHGAEE